MKVGIKIDAELATLASLRRIAKSIYECLSSAHHVVFLPREYPFVSAEARERMTEEFVSRCDVIVGVLDPEVLAARRRLKANVPFVFLTFGDLPAGAWRVREKLADLDTNDVMLVNCTSEVEIANRLFRNVRVRVIPFAFDACAFHLLDEEQRRLARKKLRFRESDRIILYAGRIVPEKNVHVLLRIFDIVCRRVPDAHLVLAGRVERASLDFFGVAPVWPANTFFKLLSRMERPESVHTVGAPDGQRLRELYNIADVKVNLTLNPDENFGLAQVEAMACGTPVIGTAWGGLKDTIVDGETGYKVSTVPTATGVKFSWWEAVNHLVALLEDAPARQAFREKCRRAAQRYSQASFAAVMEEILSASSRDRDRPAEPLRATPFAEELWSVCDPRGAGAAYRRGRRSEELYRELVTPFSGVSPEHVPAGEALEPDQVLSLATPVHLNGVGRFRPDDVFYPFEVEVPAAHQAAVQAILTKMSECPAIPVGKLADAVMGSTQELSPALAWMLETGVVLRTRPMPGWMAPEVVDRRLADAAFSLQRLDRAATDLIVYE